MLDNESPIYGDPLSDNSSVLVSVTRATVSATDFADPAARETVFVCGERNLWCAFHMSIKL
jgi:hypothetical protein